MTLVTAQHSFQKEKFVWDGMFLTYGDNRDFIARFKYGRKPYKTWINFLVKNFTVEEYLRLIDHKNPEHVAPLTALETKGFVSPNKAKVAKRDDKVVAFYTR